MGKGSKPNVFFRIFSGVSVSVTLTSATLTLKLKRVDGVSTPRVVTRVEGFASTASTIPQASIVNIVCRATTGLVTWNHSC